MKKSVGILMVGLSALTVTCMVTPAHAQCPTDIGAAISAECSCAGPKTGGVWKNHGQFQRCVVQYRNTLRRQGCLNAATQKTIASCAARSTCGKPDAVLCCTVTGTGTCNAQPDGSLKCSNDGSKACLSAADCTKTSGPRMRRDATACTSHGGYVSGVGSVCAGCTPPVACCLSSGECKVTTAANCAGTPTGSVPVHSSQRSRPAGRN
jgi:hypothetical protein